MLPQLGPERGRQGLPVADAEVLLDVPGFRIPGMTVLTAGCARMWRSASSGIVMPVGHDGAQPLDALQRRRRFSGLK